MKSPTPNQQVGKVRKKLVDLGIEVPDPKLGETAEAYRGRLAERLREFREGVGGGASAARGHGGQNTSPEEAQTGTSPVAATPAERS